MNLSCGNEWEETENIRSDGDVLIFEDSSQKDIRETSKYSQTK